MGSSSRSTRWTFTLNNPGTWRPEFLETLMAYLVYGEETGESGTFHLQGYVRFKNRQTMKAVKRLLHEKAHLELCKGHEKQNRDYCTKDQKFTEFGTFDPEAGRQGRRNDLIHVVDKIKEGKSVKEIAAEFPETFIKHHSGIEKLHRALRADPPAQRDINVMVLWGPTNVGKTHRVRVAYPEVYSVRPGKNPWDDYNDEDIILFDEFRPEDWTIVEMNMFLDKWPCRLNCRYNNKQASWTKVFICANTDPDRWYCNESLNLFEAFKRRLHKTVEIVSKEQQVDLVDLPVTVPASPVGSPQRPQGLRRAFSQLSIPCSLTQLQTQLN